MKAKVTQNWHQNVKFSGLYHHTSFKEPGNWVNQKEENYTLMLTSQGTTLSPTPLPPPKKPPSVPLSVCLYAQISMSKWIDKTINKTNSYILLFFF